jgi:hypothetical protein
MGPARERVAVNARRPDGAYDLAAGLDRDAEDGHRLVVLVDGVMTRFAGGVVARFAAGRAGGVVNS